MHGLIHGSKPRPNRAVANLETIIFSPYYSTWEIIGSFVPQHVDSVYLILLIFHNQNGRESAAKILDPFPAYRLLLQELISSAPDSHCTIVSLSIAYPNDLHLLGVSWAEQLHLGDLPNLQFL